MSDDSSAWILFGADKSDPNRLRSASQLEEFIQVVGFLPLFHNRVPGFSVEEHTLSSDWWSGREEVDPWEWRRLLAGSERVAYGRFFCGKAGYISLDWLPRFLNWRRDGYDFDARWDDQKASYRAKRIMETLEQSGSLLSPILKATAGFGPGGEKNFEGTLTALEMQGYVCIQNFLQRINKSGLPYGWHIALLSTPEHIWGSDFAQSAYCEEPELSRTSIMHHLAEQFPSADENTISGALG